MNKQVVIASMIAAASAEAEAVACDDAFTKRARSNLDDAQFHLEVLEGITAGLEATAADELTLFNTADGRASAQTTLMAPFLEAKTQALAAYETDNAATTAATSAITALAAPITAAGTAKGAAQALVDAQQALIDAQQLVVDKLVVAQTEHTTELATMQTLLTTATANLTAATTAVTTANASATALIAERDTAVSGQAALQTATAATLATETSEYDTAITDEGTAAGTYQPAQLALDKQTLLCTLIDIGCTGNHADVTNGSGAVTAFTGGTSTPVTGIVAQQTCVGQTNGPILTMKTACDTTRDGSLTSTQSSQSSTWQTAVTTVATKWTDKTTAHVANVVALANLTTINSSITSLQATTAAAIIEDLAAVPPVTGVAAGALAADVTAKTTAKDTAQTNYDTVNGQLTQANADLARGNDLMSTLTAALVPLNDDLVVKTYLEKVQTDLLAEQEAAKAVAQANLTDLDGLVTLAAATVDRAQETMDFYQGLLDTATASKALADQMVAENAGEIAAQAGVITGLELALAEAISNCKGAGYLKAQAALEAKVDAEDTRIIDHEILAADYAIKIKHATDGTANTLCGFPPKAKDAAQEPRPLCNEGFCCGAAQKFLKDGTKLAVETCQKAEGVHTYTYYPPLPEGATVEPLAETWRFQCISGAQKLFAATTAALAASYMMA